MQKQALEKKSTHNGLVTSAGAKSKVDATRAIAQTCLRNVKLVYEEDQREGKFTYC